MININHVSELHRAMVARWHEQPLDSPYDGFLAIVCRQLSYNYLLWHEEDIARSPDESDARIAEVKRNIDRYNQLRNDWMERIDDWIAERLVETGVTASPAAPQNTETPGSAIDRLAILALRCYHLEEQAQRDDASPEHRVTAETRLALCREQLHDLKHAVQQLLDDIFAGRKRHKTYRHLKMYNDPTMNPYLYQPRQRAAG